MKKVWSQCVRVEGDGTTTRSGLAGVGGRNCIMGRGIVLSEVIKVMLMEPWLALKGL